MNLLWAIVAQTAVIVGGCVVINFHSRVWFNAIDRRLDDRLRRRATLACDVGPGLAPAKADPRVGPTCRLTRR